MGGFASDIAGEHAVADSRIAEETVNHHRIDAIAIGLRHDVRAVLHHPLIALLVVENVRSRHVGDLPRERRVRVTGIDLAVDDLGVTVVEDIALAATEGYGCDSDRNRYCETLAKVDGCHGWKI
ncbi:hypothetical protein [Burkholderia thailandensis]|uniref:hypothetical protein n=1 Tax=Burkholderia thailandensis TaxID=57975 RepID=UPI0012DAB403